MDEVAPVRERDITCCCCGGSARRQCADHDRGYGVCDSCLAEFGRKALCRDTSCRAHDEVLRAGAQEGPE